MSIGSLIDLLPTTYFKDKKIVNLYILHNSMHKLHLLSLSPHRVLAVYCSEMLRCFHSVCALTSCGTPGSEDMTLKKHGYS